MILFSSKRLTLLLAAWGWLLFLAACAPPELPATPAPDQSPSPAQTLAPAAATATPIHATLPPPSIPEKTMTPMRRKQPLTGIAWQLTSYAVNDVTQQALPDHPAHLVFEDGHFSGNTGCNGFSGSYAIEGDAIRFEIGPMTMRACLEDVADQEAAYLAGLENAASYRIDDGQLTLYDATGRALLTFTVQKSLALTDGAWQLLSFNNGQGGMEANRATARITARFSEDGWVSGNAGCNTFRGSYEANGDRIAIGPLVTTRMMCAEDVMAVEKAFLQGMARASRYQIEEGRLSLMDEAGVILLIFLPAP